MYMWEEAFINSSNECVITHIIFYQHKRSYFTTGEILIHIFSMLCQLIQFSVHHHELRAQLVFNCRKEFENKADFTGIGLYRVNLVSVGNLLVYSGHVTARLAGKEVTAITTIRLIAGYERETPE